MSIEAYLKKYREIAFERQIKEKYALPSIPTKYTDVSFKPGDVLRYGKIAPNFGGVGCNAYGFVSGARSGSIFNTVEFPTLIKNPNVTNIFTEIFAKGGS